MSDEKLRNVGIQLELNIVLVFRTPTGFVKTTMFSQLIDMLKTECCLNFIKCENISPVCIIQHSDQQDLYEFFR